ncbi:MAG: hypothetical protein J3Q66DRAFT_327996 [Benniella sp.]|nr:MAG: hypothetical protein J3Q66DRAFT_327996 [Benniella sp.]
MSSPAAAHHHDHDHRGCNFNTHQEYQSHQVHPSSYEGDGYFRCCTAPPISPSMSMGVDHHSHSIGNGKAGISPGHRPPSRTLLGSETTASMFKTRRSSNTDMSKSDSDSAVDKEKESHDLSGIEGGDHLHPMPLRLQRDIGQEGPGHIENLLSPTSPAHSSPMITPSSTVVSSGEEHHFDVVMPTDEDMFSFGQRDNNSQDYQLNCCCCCAELSSSSANGMSTTDHPMVLSNARPISYGSQEFRGVLNQRAARSEASSPVDAQFPLSQGGAPSALTQPRRSLPSLEKTSMTSTEKSDGALEMSNSSNKGRSTSELDLLLTPIQEYHPPRISKYSTAPIMGMTSINPPVAKADTASFSEAHIGYSTEPWTLVSMPPTIAPSVSVPPNSSMKNRAQYFLSLVRRRASSNDTPGLVPNAHLGSKLPASPLGTSSSTTAQHDSVSKAHHVQCHHGHHHHNHHCHHHYHHHHPNCHYHSRQHPSAYQRPNTTLPQHPFQQDNSPAVIIPGQPPRFKEGYILRSKTPPQINTSFVKSASGNTSVDHHQDGTPLSSSTMSSTSYTSSCSLPSAPLRSSAGGTSISPHSLRSFPSRDRLNRASFSVDRKRSYEILGFPRISPGGTPPTSSGSNSGGKYPGFEGTGRKGSAPEVSSERMVNLAFRPKSPTTPPPSKLGAMPSDATKARYRQTSIIDMGDHAAGWKLFAPPQTSTPMSLRPMGSRGSFGPGSTVATVAPTPTPTSSTTDSAEPVLSMSPNTEHNASSSFQNVSYGQTHQNQECTGSSLARASFSAGSADGGTQAASGNTSTLLPPGHLERSVLTPPDCTLTPPDCTLTPPDCTLTPPDCTLTPVLSSTSTEAVATTGGVLLGKEAGPSEPRTVNEEVQTAGLDVSNKIVKRVASEVFQGREGRLVKMTSLQDLTTDKDSMHR